MVIGYQKESPISGTVNEPPLWAFYFFTFTLQPYTLPKSLKGVEAFQLRPGF